MVSRLENQALESNNGSLSLLNNGLSISTAESPVVGCHLARPMAKRKNLKGIPHNFTKSFFGTERYYSRGYMGDWLSNAARRLNLKEATLDIMTATFSPAGLNLHPLNLHARDLKSIIEKELIRNGFEPGFILEAQIKFQFLESTVYKRTINCFPYMIDKEGKRYDTDVISEDVFEIHFDPFDELNLSPAKQFTFFNRIKKLFR